MVKKNKEPLEPLRCWILQVRVLEWGAVQRKISKNLYRAPFGSLAYTTLHMHRARPYEI